MQKLANGAILVMVLNGIVKIYFKKYNFLWLS